MAIVFAAFVFLAASIALSGFCVGCWIHFQIGRSEQIVSAKRVSTEVSEYLKTRVGAAILGLTQVSYLVDGTAFEYVLSQYVAY